MVISTHKCTKCESKNIVLNGKNRSGSLTFKCKDCGCCRVLFSVKKTQKIDFDALARTHEERNSLRSTGRIFGISHVTNLLKKVQSLADFKTTIETTHQKVGKETGQTTHVERLNNTIRQRFSRFVRKPPPIIL